MDLTEYRNTTREQERIADLLRLVPLSGCDALDIGARDGYLSRLLTQRFTRVIALDLEEPTIEHEGVEPVCGDASQLDYADSCFDLVLCSEVLEHIPSNLLAQVCREIARVTAGTAVIGVPYRQDLRHGRTLCRTCNNANPPWGHVNSFDTERLLRLFPDMQATEISFAGRTTEGTNFLSAALMDYAGHPYGTYSQEERCIHCGSRLEAPPQRGPVQRIATRAAHLLNAAQQRFARPRGNWIHVRFEKSKAGSAPSPRRQIAEIPRSG